MGEGDRRYSFGAERCFMDSGDRGAVAGDAQEVPAVSDLPSPLSAMGAFGEAGESVAEAGRTVAG
jgi:hypothetical protein